MVVSKVRVMVAVLGLVGLAATFSLPAEAGTSRGPVFASLPPATAPFGPEGSVYVTVAPCRVLDTRAHGGQPISVGQQRSVDVSGAGPAFAAQGGRAGGCGIPASAAAASVSVSVVSPGGSGFLRAWPRRSQAPNATVVNFRKAENTTNTAALSLAAGGLIVAPFGAPTHLVLDVQGYFVEPGEPAGIEGASFHTLSGCRVLDTRRTAGPIRPRQRLDVRVTGSGAALAGQGGRAGGCGVPDDAVAVEASITAVGPAGPGFARSWPAGSPAPAATVLNFSRGRSTTNTGPIGMAEAGVPDVSIEGFGGSSNYVMDVQGYYRPTSSLGARATRSGEGDLVYVPMVPCRVVDTRSAGGPLASGERRDYRVAGAGTEFAPQGGVRGGCALPDSAAAVSASISAVDPGADGYLRAGPSGPIGPSATFLNFTSGQGTTNTGSIAIAQDGILDLALQGSGGPSDYVVDIQGWYATSGPSPTPGTIEQITQSNRGSGRSSVSDDGRFVLYQTGDVDPADELVWPYASGPGQILLLDRTTGTTTTVAEGSGSGSGIISGDATTVTYWSSSPDLVPDDHNGRADVFVWTRSTGVTERITDGDRDSFPFDISADGRTVGITSLASNLAPGDVNGKRDLFLWDRTTGAIQRIVSGETDTYGMSLSPDGSMVSFANSFYDPTAQRDRNRGFVWHRSDGSVTPIDIGGFSTLPGAFSGDGRYLLVRADMADGGLEPIGELFRVDLQSGATRRITYGNIYSDGGADISDDGQTVAFGSAAFNLVAGYNDGGRDLFVWQAETGSTSRLPLPTYATPRPRISGDGRWVTYTSLTPFEVPETETSGFREDVFLWDLDG